MKKLTILIALCSLTAFSLHSQQTSHFDGQSWWGYVKVLADDNMEGRETGSPDCSAPKPMLSNSSRKTDWSRPAPQGSTSR